jgi:hypothetical protein
MPHPNALSLASLESTDLFFFTFYKTKIHVVYNQILDLHISEPSSLVVSPLNSHLVEQVQIPSPPLNLSSLSSNFIHYLKERQCI